MPGIKVLLQFTSQQYSWSEAYWWLTTSTPLLNQAQAPAIQLATLRVPLLGNGASLMRMRLSTQPANRQVIDLLPPSFPTAPNWPQFTFSGTNIGELQYAAARPFEALLLLCQAADGSTKNLYLAGIPAGLARQESADNLGIQWTDSPEFLNRLNAFIAYLSNSNWGWLTQRDEVFQAVNAIVTNAAFPGTVGVQLTSQVAFSDPLHPKLRIKGFRRLNTRLQNIDGVWTVSGVLPPTAPATSPWTYFLLNSASVGVGNYANQGVAAPYQATFRIISSVQPVKTVSRKRGGSLGLPRGKLRTRR